jgi:hypothetical protein
VKLNESEFRKRVYDLLNGKIDFADNIFCRTVDVPDTGTANVAFTVTHGLGRTPIAYIWNINAAGIVYDHDRDNWTTTTLTLKCSISNAEVRLIVV